MLKSYIDRVKDFWGSPACNWRSGQIIHWLQHPRVQERIRFLVGGDIDKDRFRYFIDTYLADRLPLERALTLGCGLGELERGLVKYNFALHHDGLDLSESSVEEATRLASEAGLQNLIYRTADFNSIQLPHDTYDVVLGPMTIHHIEALEHLFQQVSQSLKANGYFFMDEYVGPNQFQWPDEQIALVNEQLAALPRRFKMRVTDSRYPKDPVRRPTLDEMNTLDPSEAIRSSEIVPLLSKYFDVAEVTGYGGTLLHLLLEDIAENFGEDKESQTCLESLFAVEDRLIASGRLTHDFAVIVARKRTLNSLPLAEEIP